MYLFILVRRTIRSPLSRDCSRETGTVQTMDPRRLTLASYNSHVILRSPQQLTPRPIQCNPIYLQKHSPNLALLLRALLCTLYPDALKDLSLHGGQQPGSRCAADAAKLRGATLILGLHAGAGDLGAQTLGSMISPIWDQNVCSFGAPLIMTKASTTRLVPSPIFEEPGPQIYDFGTRELVLEEGFSIVYLV